jgi:dipeptidyl aminopeptidase/acylaminoacyl peptidase
MMTLKLRRSLCCAALLVLAAIAPVSAATEPVPHAAFFQNTALSHVKLSPDGRYLSMVVSSEGKRDRLGVLTLADMSMKAVAQFGNLDVRDAEWVDSERLVFNTRDAQVGAGDAVYAPGLFAVNRDGSEHRQLVHVRKDKKTSVGSNISQHMLPTNTYMLSQRGAQNSPFVYVRSVSYDYNEARDTKLLRLDTLSGKSVSVPHPPNPRQWLLDHKGEPRLVISIDKSIQTIHYREPGSEDWRKVAEFDVYKDGRGTLAPLGFGPDGKLYVSARATGTDHSALYTFDLGTGQLSKEPLLALTGFDFTGSLVFGKERLLGVHYTTDADATQWYDPAMKASQAAIDAVLPNTVNHLSVPQHGATPWILVKSHSDVQPTVYRLYNSQTKAMAKIGETHPKIDPARMATQDPVRYKARDGLEIPAYLTLPQGDKKNLPMVVLVHGGPYLRGSEWGWNAQAQFLASRGYAVLQPEFRGSTGYGDKHYRAGWKQWGLAMQNDIADGARWAIAEGYADAKRICIAGASYGGYATLMGLLNDPDLFQCGINWVGVTDIELMYKWTPDGDLSSGYRQYGMPDLVGDRVKDAAQLKATSPVQQAARITRPVMLAYGGADRRVPIEHGKTFYEAVKATNKDVEWVVYWDEGHGWTLPANRIDFWTRVEKFLDKHIGKR